MGQRQRLCSRKGITLTLADPNGQVADAAGNWNIPELVLPLLLGICVRLIFRLVTGTFHHMFTAEAPGAGLMCPAMVKVLAGLFVLVSCNWNG